MIKPAIFLLVFVGSVLAGREADHESHETTQHQPSDRKISSKQLIDILNYDNRGSILGLSPSLLLNFKF